jgi:predicted CoA-binding protein
MAESQDIHQETRHQETRHQETHHQEIRHQETHHQEIRDDASVTDVLRRYQRVAVIGAHTNEQKAAHYVPKYLVEHGYDVFPVNPRAKGQMLFGHKAVGTLLELHDQNIDIVNVFRRSDKVGLHLEEMLELAPKLVWLQLGIRNDDVAKALMDAGIEVIQDRCMLADHRKFIVP